MPSPREQRRAAARAARAARAAITDLVDAHTARRQLAGRDTPRWMKRAAVALRMRAWRRGELTLEQIGADLEGQFARIAAMGEDAAQAAADAADATDGEDE